MLGGVPMCGRRCVSTGGPVQVIVTIATTAVDAVGEMEVDAAQGEARNS